MSEPIHVRDWQELPLDPGGRSLIEASAGTGKTWTISALYLRLLLDVAQDGGVPPMPRGIAVATFTDAAADELRERIGRRLLRAEQIAAALPPDAARMRLLGELDDAERWLETRWRDDAARRERERTRLRLALGELDLAPIGTLHGLCARILRDFPFESGGAFVPGELVAGDEIIDELADDLWRRLQQGDAPAPPFGSVKSRDKLREQLKWCLMPGIGLWAPSKQQLDEELHAAWAPRITALADERNIWGQQRNSPKALRSLAAWLADRDAPFGSGETKRLGVAVEHMREHAPEREETAFLAKAVRILEYAAAAPEIRDWQRWTALARSWRETRLAASDRLTFDDLLTRVHDALALAGSALADSLYAQWPVALVDEFQDTDATQYAILDRIYRDAAGVPRGRLVMIGDPKQAIYRFRGGDIATYRRAKAAAQAQLTLGVNRRSTRAYVAALNEWFARMGRELSARAGGDAIRVEDVSAWRTDDITGAPARALVLHYRAAAPDSAHEREESALVACAEQIVALLDDAVAHVDGKRVVPGDIAVLLPAHRHVQQLRALLAARRVPCVGAGKGSVFDTDWARELQIVLHAIEYGGEGAQRAALATRLGGLGYAELVALRNAPERAEASAREFDALKQKWRREGVLAVVLVLAQRAAQRIPGMAERERALTDLRHLGELLEDHAQHVHGSEQLLAWLAAQRRRSMDEADPSDERLLRIESDAQRVRLMTLHMSKGLEFPVVMLPLMWAHRQRNSREIAVIEEPLCAERVIGYGSRAEAQFDAEGQNERFRVLYVALTRAKSACHVWAYSPRRPQQVNSEKWLVDPERSALDAMLDRLLAGTDAPVPALEYFDWRSEPWPQSETLYHPAQREAAARPIVLEPPPIPQREDLWSFSALTRTRAAREEEGMADDESDSDVGFEGDTQTPIDAAAQMPDAVLAELDALRGAEFGNALHQVFEQRRLGMPIVAQAELVDRALRDNGVYLRDLPRPLALARIAARLDSVLAADLGGGLSLAALPARALRAEMDFRFTLDAVSLRRLCDVCAQHGQSELVPAQVPAQMLRGLMTGKIDLVIEHGGRFHVLDYKSNHLGGARADYAPAALRAAMGTHHYRFQALLYTVALDRYLRTRIADYRRERHLGDAIYLFVRAVGIAPGLGIWRARFDDALIASVDRVFAGAREAA